MPVDIVELEEVLINQASDEILESSATPVGWLPYSNPGAKSCTDTSCN